MSLGDAQTALSVLSSIIEGIDKIMAWRAQRKSEKEMRIMHQNRFLHQFALAGAPVENATEDETIRSYCQKLRQIITSHWSFIFGKGAKRAEAAHAVMATTLLHCAAWPGLPLASPAPQLPAPVARPVSPVNGIHTNFFFQRLTSR
jgi:hypothetical protein